MQRDLLIKGLSCLKLPTDEGLLRAFETYMNELLRWNKAYNLTAITKQEDIINKHFLDSLLYSLAMPTEPLSVCDVGSGAGFPGIPLALVMKQTKFTLVEPSRKKAAFLAHLRQLLQLSNVRVINSRVEELVDSTFEVITTRALFDARQLVKKTERLLSDGGFYVLSLGVKSKEKVREEFEGYHSHRIETFIPNTDIKRTLLVLRPIGASQNASI